MTCQTKDATLNSGFVSQIRRDEGSSFISYYIKYIIYASYIIYKLYSAELKTCKLKLTISDKTTRNSLWTDLLGNLCAQFVKSRGLKQEKPRFVKWYVKSVKEKTARFDCIKVYNPIQWKRP